MKIVAVPFPLQLTPQKALKSPQILFGEGEAAKPDVEKKSRIQFSIYNILMLTGFTASWVALFGNDQHLNHQLQALEYQRLEHQDQLRESHDFSRLFRIHKNSTQFLMMPSRYPYEDWAFNTCWRQLDFMGWDSWKMEKVPQGESVAFAYAQHQDALFSLNADESFLESQVYPLNHASLKELYQRYLTQPDSEETLKEAKRAASVLKASPETLQSLKAQYPLYAESANGKQNPISLDEFSLMVDVYHFFCRYRMGKDDHGANEIFQRYTEVVLAKHAQNPKLPFVKPYYDGAVTALNKLNQDDKAMAETHLKKNRMAGLEILCLGAFSLSFVLPKLKTRKEPKV